MDASMIIIRECCGTLPKVDFFIDRSRIAVWCPVCGYTVSGENTEDALQKWNDHRNGEESR